MNTIQNLVKPIAASVLLIGMLGCQLISNDEEKVLTILYWQAPSVPSAYLSAGFKDIDAAAVTLEPLARFDPDGNLVPALAKEIPTIENGGVASDLTSITWKIQKGIKWSDGSEVTTDDVVFTWTYCVDPDAGCTAESSFDSIAGVEAIDSSTVKISFDAPMPYPYNAFVGSGTPIISRKQFADCIGAAASTCDKENHAPVGTGPYRIVSFEPNEGAVYERNPHYRGDEPFFDRIELIGGGTAIDAAKAVLETGEADYAWNLQIEPDQLKELETNGKGTVVAAFSSLVERVVLNQTNPDPDLGNDRSEYLDGSNPHPLLTHPPIQQAMSKSIDRALISERLYGFAGKPTCNLIVGPPNYVSSANDDCLVQDIDSAKRLLDESGIIDSDGDGTREHNGHPLQFIYQTSTNDVRQETQNLIKDWWSQIGIEVEIVHHDASLFFGGDPVTDAEATYRRFFADVQMYANGPGIDPQSYLSDSLCKHIPTRENNWSLGNVPRACNLEYDAVYEQFAATPVGSERADLVKRLNDIYIQSYYEIPLINRGLVSAHLNTLKGIQMNAWDSELWNIADWHR